MRRLALVLVALVPLSPVVASTAPLFEAEGEYVAANGYSYLVDACATYGLREGIDSNCVLLPADFSGSTIRVRDEGAFAPATQNLRVCYYAEINWMIQCLQPGLACPAGWAYCAKVPAGTRYVGISSATGVAVHWHLVIE